MLRLAEGGYGVALFDDHAKVHHRDPMADEADRREIVRDEKVGGFALGLDALQQIDDLGPRGRIERRGRFVQHHEVGFGDHGAGDADALLLACREFSWVRIKESGIEPDESHRVAHPAAPFTASTASAWSGSAIIASILSRGSSDSAGS